MKALNLYTLTRIKESEEFSMLEGVLSGRSWHKGFSSHEVSSLCALVDGLANLFEREACPHDGVYPDWVRYFDGFYFSYTIEHISKEFDLLKLSPDAGCVLNIELKSEAIEEERIRRQLEQNRYYLSHISRTILSYTYVMETDSLYCLNDHGYLGKCELSELAKALKRPALRNYIKADINRYFRAQDYLISPVSTPEKYLTGRYFLTNQQSEFRRQILDLLSSRGTGQDGSSFISGMEPPPLSTGYGVSESIPASACRTAAEKADTGETADKAERTGSAANQGTAENERAGDKAERTGSAAKQCAAENERVGDKAENREKGGVSAPSDHVRSEIPVISLTGNAGTGKTLLLFDLARELSRKRKVLFIHGGPLRDGHRLIDRRLHKVKIFSGTDPEVMEALCGQWDLSDWSVILVDEANRFSTPVLRGLLEKAEACGIPCIFSYDPHSILGPIPPMEDAENLIGSRETLHLELSGNIRINRPIFSFLRTLFHRKDRPGHVDYSCIDVLYAADGAEERALTAHYLSQGYELITASHESFRTGEIISQEFDKVLMILDKRFYYDENQALCARGAKDAAIPPLYEGLSRAREKLCLVVVGNRELYSQILAIRTQ